jgi:hypothetical protein
MENATSTTAPSQDSAKDAEKAAAAAQKAMLKQLCTMAFAENFVIESRASIDMVYQWRDKPQMVVGDGRPLEKARRWVVNISRSWLFEVEGVTPPLSAWMEAYNEFEFFSEYRTQILPYRMADDPLAAAHHLVPPPELGFCPQWDEFCSRLSDAEAFMAWVWALFSNAPSRQILFLIGNGSDGKTTVLNSLRECIGLKASVEFGQRKLSNERSEFSIIDLFRKRLCIVPDCTDPKILGNSLVRSVSGREYQTAAVKFGSSQDFQLNAMMCVSTNKQPHIDDSLAERSRLLPISVSAIEGSARDPSVPDRLVSEFPFFLYQCQRAFQQRCHDGVTISLSNRTEALIDGCISDSVADIQDIVDMYFVLDGTARVSNKILKHCLLQLWNQKQFDTSIYGNFHKFASAFVNHILRVHSIEKGMHRLPGVKTPVYGFRGICPKKGVRLDVAQYEGNEWCGPTWHVEAPTETPF